MGPNSRDFIQEKSKEWMSGEEEEYSQSGTTQQKELEIVWINVVATVLLHLFGIYGLYLTFVSAKFYTVIFLYILYRMTIIGITAGAHRLWSHRSYKATTALKLILVFWFSMAHQNSVITWVRDHRMHHKYDGTNADPYSIHRGFFFAHIGWLMCKKHEDIKTKGEGLDLSDLYNDPILRFQHRYHVPLMMIACFVIPTLLPMVWDETFKNAFFLNMLRFIAVVHSSSLINSWAHKWGNKPYNKSINATQSAILGLIAAGEGWHNYHHSFPWDYRASEFGRLNSTKQFIDLCAKIGWAYDLKTTTDGMIRHTVQRTGDGTHATWRRGD